MVFVETNGFSWMIVAGVPRKFNGEEMIVRYISQKCHHCGEEYSGEETVCARCMESVEFGCKLIANMLKSTNVTVVVWQFHDAPEHFQALSGHGGDEDWLAFVPTEDGNIDHINWIESIGRCNVTYHSTKHGVIVIGAHA